MTNPDSSQKKSRGKPKNYRGKDGLYDQILEILKQDKLNKGEGKTAFKLSKELKVPDPTVRKYIKDLVDQKKVSPKKVLGMTLYSLRGTV